MTGDWTATRSRHAAQGCRASARLPWVSRTPAIHRTATGFRHARSRSPIATAQEENRNAVPPCSPGVDAQRPLLGNEAPKCPHPASDPNGVPSCSPRVPSLGEAPLGFAGHIVPIAFPDRNAVPSGGEAWPWRRSGDGTPVGFVIGDRGWCGGAGPRRALAIARHS